MLARDYRTAACELWVYPASGGDRIAHRLPIELRGLSVAPDGTVASVRIESHRQVWVLENFLPAATKSH